MQFVDLTLSFRVLKLPHPLLADDVNIECVVRDRIFLEINFRSPCEHEERDNERDDRPGTFKHHGTGNGPRYFVRVAPAVLYKKEKNGREDQDAEKDRGPD